MQKLQAKQAAVLHFDVRPMPVAEGADAGGHVDDAKAAQQIGQFALVGDDFGDARQRGDFLRRPRGVAAHHDDPRSGISGGQLADRLPAFGVAFVRDRAGVDDAQIGGFAALGIAKADAGKRLADEFGFVLVDFAAERDGSERGHG